MKKGVEGGGRGRMVCEVLTDTMSVLLACAKEM